MCVLHNFCLERDLYIPNDMFVKQANDERNVTPASESTESDEISQQPQSQQSQTHNERKNAKNIQEEFNEYFVSRTGELPWQNDQIQRH